MCSFFWKTNFLKKDFHSYIPRMVISGVMLFQGRRMCCVEILGTGFSGLPFLRKRRILKQASFELDLFNVRSVLLRRHLSYAHLLLMVSWCLFWESFSSIPTFEKDISEVLFSFHLPVFFTLLGSFIYIISIHNSSCLWYIENKI